MNQQSLPVIDPARTEFGFERTVCACAECVLNCHHIPGYLIPADLDRLFRALAPGADPLAWARKHLLASPGALIAINGQLLRIPTLVPARRPDGACTFLTADDRCAIHALAPFACAFFDCYMSADEADTRSTRGLCAVMNAWLNGSLYAQVWTMLDRWNLQAPAPEVCRQRLRRALAQHQTHP